MPVIKKNYKYDELEEETEEAKIPTESKIDTYENFIEAFFLVVYFCSSYFLLQFIWLSYQKDECPRI